MKKADEQQRAIVKAVMRDTEEREKRKAAGKMTKFDHLVESAIGKAKKELRLPTDRNDVREIMIGKICESLEHVKPWEHLGETCLGRRGFYEYRSTFIWYVAKNMGMMDAKSTVGKDELRQYIALIGEIEVLNEQIKRLGENRERIESREELKARIDAMTSEIERYVFDIKDSEIRQMITVRYLDPHGRRTWQQVANEMNRNGGYYTADYCRVAVRRFMR